ncbi:unnamed protein product [Boreogadus saida]
MNSAQCLGAAYPSSLGPRDDRLLLNMGSGGAEDRKEEEARLRVEAARGAGGVWVRCWGAFEDSKCS